MDTTKKSQFEPFFNRANTWYEFPYFVPKEERDYNKDDESTLADLCRSLGVSLTFSTLMYYCVK